MVEAAYKAGFDEGCGVGRLEGELIGREQGARAARELARLLEETMTEPATPKKRNRKKALTKRSERAEQPGIEQLKMPIGCTGGGCAGGG